MKIAMKESIGYKGRINDFGIDPVNKRIITTGEKLTFFNEGKIEKELTGKVKNCKIIKYIKDKSQLFVSSIFFISTENGRIYKCDSRKRKIIEEVYDFGKNVDVMDFTTGGRIVFIEGNVLYSYEADTKELFYASHPVEAHTSGNYRLFISGENVILKYRELHEQSNIINIFDDKLEKILDIRTENNHIYSRISGLDYIAGTDRGEIEIWHILEGELYNSVKVSNSRITYIEKTENNFIIGNGSGDIIVTDMMLEIQSVQNIFKGEVIKICGIDGEIFAMGMGNRIVRLEIQES